jgi:hypothetical protein
MNNDCFLSVLCGYAVGIWWLELRGVCLLLLLRVVDLKREGRLPSDMVVLLCLN